MLYIIHITHIERHLLDFDIFYEFFFLDSLGRIHPKSAEMMVNQACDRAVRVLIIVLYIYYIQFIFVIIFRLGSAHFFETIEGEVSDGQQLFYSLEPNNNSCSFSNKHIHSCVLCIEEVFLRTFLSI